MVEKVRRGEIRVPRFQRGLIWGPPDVVDLFDSIYRGYPIGSLLFLKRPAEAERLEIGPLLVTASETHESWWVVDGQQRITSLAVCLARELPLPTEPSDPYVVYFDAARQRFVSPPRSGRIESSWVPLPHLLDAAHLSEWVHGWKHGDDTNLRRAVFEAGTRIRDYPIPLYLIDTEDEEVAEQIFYRVNKTGKALQWEDVHKALFGGRQTSPSTLPELAQALAEVGMGKLDEKRLLTCLVALRGLDPTRTFGEHYRRDETFLRGAVLEALPVLRRVLSFLRADAGIPHLRLLPESTLLDVLTCFFARHEDPKPRTRILLARWFWRVVFGAAAFDERTLRRRGIDAVTDDEEESAQRLLALVRKERPRQYELPQSSDARADERKIAMLALVHLEPRELLTGGRIDVAELLERDGIEAFVRVVGQADIPGVRSPANRLIQTKGTPVRKLLLHRIAAQGLGDPVLAGHAIDPEAAGRLLTDDAAGFLAARGARLTAEVRLFGERMAAWDQSDRPSIEYLLAEAGAEA
ncbi:MAG: DUF262 domain-containing protein [Candidatus Rokuibacteriota bacterium]